MCIQFHCLDCVVVGGAHDDDDDDDDVVALCYYISLISFFAISKYAAIIIQKTLKVIHRHPRKLANQPLSE